MKSDVVLSPVWTTIITVISLQSSSGLDTSIAAMADVSMRRLSFFLSSRLQNGEAGKNVLLIIPIEKGTREVLFEIKSTLKSKHLFTCLFYFDLFIFGGVGD